MILADKPYTIFMRKRLDLVQVLVIVACLGIVASVLFPLVSQAREKSRAGRLDRFGRVARAVLDYSTDNDDLAPHFYATGATNQYHQTDTWVGRVYPYVGRREVFFDPTTAEPRSNFRDADGDLYVDSYYGGNSATSPYTYRWQWITTIGLNADGFATGASGSCKAPIPRYRPRNLASLTAPESRLMLAPTQMDPRLGWMYFRSGEAMRPYVKGRRPKGFSWFNLVWDARNRWHGRMNAAFADGHVGKFGKEKFVPESVSSRSDFCAYLAANPEFGHFWGEPWSMH